jgi:hypothetical protein
MSSFRLSLLALCTVGAAACASANTQSVSQGPAIATQSIGDGRVGRMALTTTRDEAEVTSVPFGADAVFAVLPAIMDSLGVPVATMDRAKRQIGIIGFKLRNRLGRAPLSTLMDCGGSSQIGPNADSYDVVISVMTVVTAAGAESANIATLVEAQARPATYAQAYNRCSTKGTLEQRIVDAVTRRLRK